MNQPIKAAPSSADKRPCTGGGLAIKNTPAALVTLRDGMVTCPHCSRSLRVTKAGFGGNRGSIPHHKRISAVSSSDSNPNQE